MGNAKKLSTSVLFLYMNIGLTDLYKSLFVIFVLCKQLNILHTLNLQYLMFIPCYGFYIPYISQRTETMVELPENFFEDMDDDLVAVSFTSYSTLHCVLGKSIIW